jgi:outer membrane receptor protein involved in Fe transport
MKFVGRTRLATVVALQLGAGALAAADEPAADENLEEIIVTGSRIQQRLEDAPVAVIVVSREDIERASQDSIGKVLQQLPANTGFSSNTNVNNGGDGSTRINLRGLGAERTLILVNGRRFVYGGNGGNTSVDVNMIPLSVVERAEVMGVGSSTIYGSDAIGGVVNLITRNDYEGAEISGSYTTNDHDDGHVADIQFVAGQSSERGYLTFGGELVNQHAVLQGDRDYSARTEYLRTDGSIGTTGSPATPQGLFRIPNDNALGLPAGRYTRVDGSRNPPTAGDFRPFVRPGDLYDFAPINYLQTPSKREYLWLLGGYDVSDRISFFVEALLHSRDSEQLLAPTPFYSFDPSGGAPILPDGEPGIPADNYYNPFGVNLEFPNFVLRRFSETVGRRYSENVQTQWYVAGLRGTISDSTWSWELSADYGRNDTDETSEGQFRADHLQLALGPSGPDASGRIVCGAPDPETGIVPAANVIPGCVPMNLFGGQGPKGNGTITHEMLDYATATLTDRGYNEQQVYELVFRGEWGFIQDRAIRWAAGTSHRVETARDRLDPAKLAGIAGDAPTNLTGGGAFTANEAYVETVVPLLRDRPAVEELNVTGGLRYSDFSSFGSVTTYQGGIMYRPTGGITLRGGYGTVFRSPPIVALYESNLVGFDGFPDPCGNSPTAEQAANCAAAGVPGGSYEQPEDDLFSVVLGGNRDLQPEEGDSASLGISLAPAATPGLGFSVDYWRTLLDDVITIGPSGQVYANACADSGAADACERIQRRPDGSIAMVDVRHANGASLVAAGYDFDLGYHTPLAGGDISARVTATYLDRYDYVPVSGAKTIDAADTDRYFGALPRWRGLGYLEYSRSQWSASYQAQYIGTMKDCGKSDLDDAYEGCRQIDDRWYQDVRLQYSFDPGPALAFAINNLAGTDPPRVNFNSSSANTDAAAYPLLGRTYYVSLSYRIE